MTLKDPSEQEIAAFKEAHKQWLKAEAIQCNNIYELHQVYRKWLYLEEDDIDFIDVALAALLDREIPGDPVWLYLIAPPAAFKTELLRSFRVYPKAYTLDTLTTATFISGKAEKNKDTDEYEPIAGILRDIDGNTVVVKDFTTILNSSEETRTEIYGQLRSIYDGFFEKAFGTMRRKVSVESTIGLLVGVTPIIDKYTKMQSALGERFLKIRNNPDDWNAAQRALQNEGKERFMRQELGNAVKSFLETLDFTEIPELSQEQEEIILKMAMYVSRLRANVWKTYEHGRIIDIEIFGAEMVKLLAIIRGHQNVASEDMLTLGRVAKDTAEPRQQSIIDFYVSTSLDAFLDPKDIAGSVKGLYRTNVRNHLEIMEALECVSHNDEGHYGLTEKFKDYVRAVYSIPSVSLQKKHKKGLFRKEAKGTHIRDQGLREKAIWIMEQLSMGASTSDDLAERMDIPVNEMDKLLALLEREGSIFQVYGSWRTTK
jgi:hypothetical protein